MCRWTCICVFLLKVLLNWCNPFSLVGDGQSKKTSVYKHLGENWQPKDSAKFVIVLDIFTRLVIIAVEHFNFHLFILALSMRAVCMGWNKDTVHCVSKSELLWNSEKYTLFSLYVCLYASVYVCVRVLLLLWYLYSSCGTVHWLPWPLSYFFNIYTHWRLRVTSDLVQPRFVQKANFKIKA